jgi:hypothetical protein
MSLPYRSNQRGSRSFNCESGDALEMFLPPNLRNHQNLFLVFSVLHTDKAFINFGRDNGTESDIQSLILESISIKKLPRRTAGVLQTCKN